MLRPLHDALWVVDHPLKIGPIAIGTRMTVVRLADGGLFLHSPVPLDAGLSDALAALGPVRAVVAPNQLHWFYLADAARAHPEAELWVAPGLSDKRRDLPPHRVLDDTPPPLWAGTLEQVFVRGAPRANEVAFFHPASRSLLLTDLAFHIQSPDGFFARLFWGANGAIGRFGPTRMFRSIIRDKAAFRADLDRILAWDFDRVIVTHGEVLDRGGRQALRQSYAFLGSASASGSGAA